MKKLLPLASALMFSTAIVAPAQAATITYTLTGSFTGTLNGQDFTDYQATFTGIGDTATRRFQQDANFVTLTSLIARGTDGTEFVLTDTYDFFSAPSPFGTAGFKTTAGADKFAFRGDALQSYDNNSSLAPSSVTQYFSAPFDVGQGVVNITSSSGLTFSAAVAGAVPEPATWAMMIGGMGAVGGTLRRRKANVSVRYA